MAPTGTAYFYWTSLVERAFSCQRVWWTLEDAALLPLGSFFSPVLLSAFLEWRYLTATLKVWVVNDLRRNLGPVKLSIKQYAWTQFEVVKEDTFEISDV
ncbi:hypothetical protein MRX96_053881, partial [Rhipicephalus microplus]